jgi:Domain of unknown function (DUF4189)
MRKARRFLLVAMALLALAAETRHVLRADGAVAVGSTGDVVKHGIAFGMVVDLSKEKAAETALSYCKAFKGASPPANARCEVVATFTRECFAVALDPQPATPGAGWGVGKDQVEANDKAMTMCEQTAGPMRKAFCEVKSAGCDTKN